MLRGFPGRQQDGQMTTLTDMMRTLASWTALSLFLIRIQLGEVRHVEGENVAKSVIGRPQPVDSGTTYRPKSTIYQKQSIQHF